MKDYEIVVWRVQTASVRMQADNETEARERANEMVESGHDFVFDSGEPHVWVEAVHRVFPPVRNL